MEAFCARSAISHQMINCLTEFSPEEAIARAKALDEELDRTGNLIGPLRKSLCIYLSPETLAESINAIIHDLVTC